MACPRAIIVRLDYGRSSDSFIPVWFDQNHIAGLPRLLTIIAAMAFCGRILKFTAAGTVPDLHRIPLLHNPAAKIMFLFSGQNIMTHLMYINGTLVHLQL